MCSPTDFPVTVRDSLGGKVQCLAKNSTCPPPYTLPFYAEIDKVAILTNCWMESSVSTSCGTLVKVGPKINNQVTTGTYSKLIRDSAGGARLGCLLDSTTVCPADYPFSFITVGNASNSETLKECRPLGQACSPPFIVPGKANGALSACITTDKKCESRSLLAASCNGRCCHSGPLSLKEC